MTDHMGSTCAHNYPHTKFHQCSPYRTLDIGLFLLLANQNRYANEVLNMRIRWRQITWVVLVPITTNIPSFINVAHTELWIPDFFVISQSEQICKWGIKYTHKWWQITWLVLVPPLPIYQVWRKSIIAFSLDSEGLPFDVDEKPTSVYTYISASIHTDMKTKWSFQHSWRPTKTGLGLQFLVQFWTIHSKCL